MDKNAIEVATDPEELKLLDRDERQEHRVLRELLIKLTPFQIRFVEQYIRTASAGKAAKLAGSSANNPEVYGYKLLQNPNIRNAIAIAMKKRIEASGLDTVEVIMKLREIYDAAMEAKRYDQANKACELMLKELERAESRKEALKQHQPEKLGDQDTTQDDLEKVLSIVSKAGTTKDQTTN